MRNLLLKLAASIVALTGTIELRPAKAQTTNGQPPFGYYLLVDADTPIGTGIKKMHTTMVVPDEPPATVPPPIFLTSETEYIEAVSYDVFMDPRKFDLSSVLKWVIGTTGHEWRTWVHIFITDSSGTTIVDIDSSVVQVNAGDVLNIDFEGQNCSGSICKQWNVSVTDTTTGGQASLALDNTLRMPANVATPVFYQEIAPTGVGCQYFPVPPIVFKTTVFDQNGLIWRPAWNVVDQTSYIECPNGSFLITTPGPFGPPAQTMTISYTQ